MGVRTGAAMGSSTRAKASTTAPATPANPASTATETSAGKAAVTEAFESLPDFLKYFLTAANNV